VFYLKIKEAQVHMDITTAQIPLGSTRHHSTRSTLSNSAFPTRRTTKKQ